MNTASGRLSHNRGGQGLVEYVALVALIGTALVLVMGILGQATSNAYKETATEVSRQTSHGYGSSGAGGGGYTGAPYIPASAPPRRRPPSDSASSSDPSDEVSHSGR